MSKSTSWTSFNDWIQYSSFILPSPAKSSENWFVIHVIALSIDSTWHYSSAPRAGCPTNGVCKVFTMQTVSVASLAFFPVFLSFSVNCLITINGCLLVPLNSLLVWSNHPSHDLWYSLSETTVMLTLDLVSILKVIGFQFNCNCVVHGCVFLILTSNERSFKIWLLLIHLPCLYTFSENIAFTTLIE